MLYPIMTDSRMVFDLSGIWDFALGEEKLIDDFAEIKAYEPIAVPASYNDQKDINRFRNHYGWAYYRKIFTLPKILKNERIVLRFDAVTHTAVVYLNGKIAGEHKGGFLPFEIDITDKVVLGEEQELFVAVDNKINHSTLPIGNENSVAFFGSDNPGIPSVEAGKRYQSRRNIPNFDFFNFAGINRSVRIFTTPKSYIDDITVIPSVDGKNGIIDYSVDTVGSEEKIIVTVYDSQGELSAISNGKSGRIIIQNARLWNPYPDIPYLYKLKVQYGSDNYSLDVGIRTVEVSGDKLLINGKPFYFKGAGKHEDSYFCGRGLNLCLDVKDINLLKLMGANSFRTSHYPYAEEMYQLCDREGIVIIDETSAVGIGGGANPYKEYSMHAHHRDVIRDLINRDKNHPSVIMWSLGNEPELERFSQDAYDYWHSLYELAHSLDPQNRPVTVVCCQNDYTKDITTRTMDVICINRYYGWYNLSGDLDAACYALDIELDFWQKIGKPVIITEYGADAVAGIHSNVPKMFSEEYQAEYFLRINDCLDKRNFIIGEHPWNFADFDTFDGCMRVGGNKKGIFTRAREPKLLAHYLKKRWNSIPNFNYKNN
ncbi:MAG: beta-glucuronidase [Eubacterium sp.]|nr:beta-glucuronidase [Eubacterium sp.]